jgi:hypothetical protein
MTFSKAPSSASFPVDDAVDSAEALEQTARLSLLLVAAISSMISVQVANF